MPVKIAIFEDHQSIIDGYLYRLSQHPDMDIVGTALYGQDLEPMLSSREVDVLLLDIHLPTSADNRASFPIMQAIPKLLSRYPKLRILVISMSTQMTLVQALVDSGVSGYIFKDDQSSIQKLSAIVEIIASGGMYFSPEAQRKLGRKASFDMPTLSLRQLEILAICAQYPDVKTAEIAARLNVAPSTIRNSLTQAYARLGVRTRAAALARLQQMGIIFSDPSYYEDKQG
jgi:DNA-binding NarL/FixJ family response regulator